MSRAALALALLASSLGIVACADNILKERPAQRVVKTQAVKPSFSATGSAKGQSSVCAAYRRQLALVRSQRLAKQMANSPALQNLKAKELSLNAVIADACE
jgi:hypothetical protein